MLIVVLGPDGSGKTTLAKGIADCVINADYRYLGHNPSRTYNYGGQIIRSMESKAKLLQMFGKALVLINDWIDHRTTKHELAIADRSSIDFVVGNQLFERKASRWYQWLLPLYPKPDMVLLLHGDPEAIYARKPEHPPHRLKKMSDLYLGYLNKSGIPYQTIDTTKNSIPQSIFLGLEFIQKQLR